MSRFSGKMGENCSEMIYYPIQSSAQSTYSEKDMEEYPNTYSDVSPNAGVAALQSLPIESATNRGKPSYYIHGECFVASSILVCCMLAGFLIILACLLAVTGMIELNAYANFDEEIIISIPSNMSRYSGLHFRPAAISPICRTYTISSEVQSFVIPDINMKALNINVRGLSDFRIELLRRKIDNNDLLDKNVTVMLNLTSGVILYIDQKPVDINEGPLKHQVSRYSFQSFYLRWGCDEIRLGVSGYEPKVKYRGELKEFDRMAAVSIEGEEIEWLLDNSYQPMWEQCSLTALIHDVPKK